MSKRLSFAVIVAGLVIVMVGLLNIVLGAMSVISGAFPSAVKEIHTPENREVVFWPEQREWYGNIQGKVATVEFWVDAAGSVTGTEIIGKSGSPRLDRMAKEYVEQMRFEGMPKNMQPVVQWGKITIDFDPTIVVGAIVFGLVMLTAGALWVTSGFGYFALREWASTLALYVSPIIVGTSLAGVLNFWGFSVKIGWAAISTVAGVGSIWYLSKKELASFFLISVAEHVAVLAIFAMLIYGGPGGSAEVSDQKPFLPVDVIEQQEPLLTHIIPRETIVPEKPPTLPKTRIRSVTATDPGSVIEDSVPRPPRTHAQIEDAGTDTVLKSPAPKEREQRYESPVLASDVKSALESSKKPSLDIEPSGRIKDGPDITAARRPEHVRDDIYSSDEQLGPSDEVARPSFAGEITGDLAGRRVVSWPKLPSGFKGTEGGSTTIEFSVDPAGYVTEAKAIRKSGNPALDRIAEEYVRQIRFEELPKRFQQTVQSGKISISFELIRRSG